MPHTAVRQITTTLAAAAVALVLSTVPAGAATNTITTVAGTGVQGFSGDGGPATSARHKQSHDVAVTADGGFVFTDFGDNRVRRVSSTGIITTIAGSGQIGTGGDGGPATSAKLWGPAGVAVTADGSVLIADSSNRVVRRVAPDGTITRIAGTTGVFSGPSGDGGPATSAILGGPQGVTVTPDGGYLIADLASVRKVSPAGIITTVAGTGSTGFSGDGGPATSAQVNFSSEVSLTADGGFLIADANNQRIRRVSPQGIITTVAGTGTGVFSGDGGPASAAGLNSPRGVEAAPDGGYLIAETGSNRVRRVSPAGTIATIAGPQGNCVDGTPATSCSIGSLSKVAFTPDGDILIPGSASARIFLVDAGDPYVVDTTAPSIACGSPDAQWHRANVSIACTATDVGAGLASAGDAAFALSTSVADGVENASAPTGSRAVCDVAGNCATAGPIGGNKVDRSAPILSCGTSDGAWHAQNVSIACTAGDGGSGLSSPADQAFALTTNVPAGSVDADAATDTHPAVCDLVANCSAAVGPIGGNKIDRKAPVIVLASPANGGNYGLFSGNVKAVYGCSDTGSGVASCVGTQPNGSTLTTTPLALGKRTFTVTATDVAGNTAVATHNYTVSLLGTTIAGIPL